VIVLALLLGCDGGSAYDSDEERRGVPEANGSGLSLLAHVQGEPGTMGNQQITGDGAGGAWILGRASSPVSIGDHDGGVGLVLVHVAAAGAVASLGVRDVDSPPVLALGEGPPVVGSWRVDWSGTTIEELAADASTVWSVPLPNPDGTNPRGLAHDGAGGLYVAGSGDVAFSGMNLTGRWIARLNANHVTTGAWAVDFDVTSLVPWGDKLAVAGLDGDEAVLARLDNTAITEVGRFEGWGPLEVAPDPNGPAWVARSYSGQGAFFLRRLAGTGEVTFETTITGGGETTLDLALAPGGDALAVWYRKADAGASPYARTELYAREGYLHAWHEIEFQETGGVATSSDRAWVLHEQPFGYASFGLR